MGGDGENEMMVMKAGDETTFLRNVVRVTKFSMLKASTFKGGFTSPFRT